MADQPDTLIKTEPVPLDPARYMIHSRLEIVSILGALHNSGSMITAYFGPDNDFILTAIAAVNAGENEMVMDCGADTAANQRALQAGKMTFVAAHERIKIEFSSTSLRSVRYKGRDAFCVPLPGALLRLQRREYFRIATPLTRPLKCVLGAQGASARVPDEVTIVDISCGGIAIIDSSESERFEVGACFQGCRVDMPELGPVSADILVRSTFMVTLKNGAKHKHAGCEFVGMPESERAKIQRYINKMERERKDRTGRR